MTPKPAGTLDGSPDGGWGWVVAAAAFLVNGLSYGLLRSLGLALPDIAEHFGRTAQDTAWVSALALAVQQAASEPPTPRGPVGSALSTRWGARPVVMIGGVLTSLGFLFSAFAGSLLHLYLGLGVLAAFLVFALGTALVGGGYFVPYVHLAPHALDRGLAGYRAALVVAVAAVGDAGARLVCGWVADQGWVPLPRLLAVFGALTGLGLLAVGLVPVVGGEEAWGGSLLAAAGAYGLSAGSYAPLVFGVLPGLVGIGGVVQATGLVMLLMSLGGLLGPPLSGFLRDETGDFTASFLVCGSFVLSGSSIYLGLPGALPSCSPASPPATPPPERGELLPAPPGALLSPGGPHATADTSC
ncbi:Monocarboxylate transporter 11 [Myotis davidii]|uniref:Monocarboxylate transporter 11 n=1 Tax=Myotis davidii TaxID=225400 RepID=L5LSC0_MYODS|nr:Monocarboxylate transporter 11 [Myotis davidii]